MRRLLALAIAAALALAVALPAGAGNDRNFKAAPLRGANEVPAVDSQANGVATFKLSKDGMSLEYKLIVANLNDTLQSHIHIGAPGTNGGVVAFLYPDGPPPILIPGPTSGILAQGVITAEDLIGSLAGQPLSALIDQITAGNAYVNVHTTANPGGEIRAQIS